MDDLPRLLQVYSNDLHCEIPEHPTLHGNLPSTSNHGISASALFYRPTTRGNRLHTMSRRSPYHDDKTKSPSKPKSIYDTDGILLQEQVKWNGKTFMLPVMPSILDNWKSLGFPTRAFAERVTRLMNPDTSVEERKVIAAALSPPQKRNLLAETKHTKRSRTTDDDEEDDGKPHANSAFVILAVPKPLLKTVALSATPLNATKRYPFSMTERLPSIKIPIGSHEDDMSLLGILDTGAGATLGYLPYHQEVSRRFPQVVMEYTSLKTKDYYEEHIGGVDGNGSAVTVSAAIRYALPYTVQGHRAQLVIALTNELADNTIFGVTMHKKCGFIINLENDTVHSQVFGDTFKIEYRVPSRDESPPWQTPGTGNVTLVTTPSGPASPAE
jgi:hypothetical protein